MAVEDHLSAAAQEDSVVVAVNVRPLIDLELAEGCKPCLHVTPGEPQVGPWAWQAGGRRLLLSGRARRHPTGAAAAAADTGPGFSERMHTQALMHAFAQGEQFIPAQASYAGVLARQGKMAEARKYLQDVPAVDAQQRVLLPGLVLSRVVAATTQQHSGRWTMLRPLLLALVCYCCAMPVAPPCPLRQQTQRSVCSVRCCSGCFDNS